MINNWRFNCISFLLLMLFLIGCEKDFGLSPKEGFVDVTGGKVWYRIVGEGKQIPLVLLHGGPGFPSYYLNPLSPLSKDRPVIFFDQLGCGRSEADLETAQMTVDNYVEQLEQLRKALGIKEFYLYGHSWGTMLGMDYYLKNPKPVKALIFASPALSISRWIKDANELIGTLPDSIQTNIRVNEATGNYESPDYQQAINVFYKHFVARKLPWDANLDSTFSGANMKVYNHMWGPSEFKATGILKNYERGEQLSKIKVPTLFVCGEFDEARPETVQYFQSLTPGASFAEFKGVAHISMHDDPQQDLAVISKFLSECDDN